MGKQSQAWKAVERAAAKALRGERVSRGDNFAVSDVDVKIPDMPQLKIDCKYRVSHAHHTLMREIETKYCEDKDLDIPILVTKHHNQNGAYVTLPLDHFGDMLDIIRIVVRLNLSHDFEAMLAEMKKERA